MIVNIRKNCLYCNKEFIPSRNTQKYCSHSCCSRANSQIGLKLKEKQCERCNKLYMPTSNTQTWCNECLTKICEYCGKPYRLRSKTHINRSHYCSVECRQNDWKIKMIGENSPNYKGGICKERHLAMSRQDYKDWRKAVFERDNYTCQVCGSKVSNTLNAHHIKPYKDYPKLRLDVNNGITVCKKCHRKIHSNKIEFDIQSELTQ